MISVGEGSTIEGRTPGPEEVTQPIGHEGDTPVFPAQVPATKDPEATAQSSPQQPTDPNQPEAPRDAFLDVVPSTSVDYIPLERGPAPAGTKWNDSDFAAADQDMHTAGFTQRARLEARGRFEGEMLQHLDEHGIQATPEGRRQFLVQYAPKLVDFQERHHIPDVKFDRVVANWITRLGTIPPSNQRSHLLPEEIELRSMQAEQQTLKAKGEEWRPRYKDLQARVIAGYQKLYKGRTISND